MNEKRIYLVGLGPGEVSQMTGQALAALEDADVLCGYPVYVDLVKDRFPEKQTYTTPMRQELERCRWAIETARSGKTVAFLCSGDAGVYGMAGPLLQLAEGVEEVESEVVPGVTAALSGVIRDNTPRGKVGHFQGIRMIFGVMLPMIIGPAIGAAVIRGSDSTYVDLGVVKTVPTPGIFLAAAVVLVLIIPFVAALKKRGEKEENAK